MDPQKTRMNAPWLGGLVSSKPGFQVQAWAQIFEKPLITGAGFLIHKGFGTVEVPDTITILGIMYHIHIFLCGCLFS